MRADCVQSNVAGNKACSKQEEPEDCEADVPAYPRILLEAREAICNKRHWICKYPRYSISEIHSKKGDGRLCQAYAVALPAVEQCHNSNQQAKESGILEANIEAYRHRKCEDHHSECYHRVIEEDVVASRKRPRELPPDTHQYQICADNGHWCHGAEEMFSIIFLPAPIDEVHRSDCVKQQKASKAERKQREGEVVYEHHGITQTHVSEGF